MQERGPEALASADPALKSDVEALLAQDMAGILDHSVAGILEPSSPSREVSAEPDHVLARGTISHYKLIERIGRGGMGVVYKAEDTKLHRFVALKFLSKDIDRDMNALARFRREARAASSLDHPNICTIYEIGEAAGETFIAMQFLDGHTLKDVVSAKPLNITVLLDLALQIAEALHAAHQAGIIHRDIKPANLFVTNRGQLKVLDFGLAKWQSRQPVAASALGSQLDPPTGHISRTVSSSQFGDPTSQGQLVGTVAYMSPEQVRREELDGRTDLFSFGAVLYEMATGTLPFQGDSPVLICNSILNCPITPARRINPELPARLERVIGNALEKDRERRYQSAQEMGADLQKLAGRIDQKRTPAIWFRRAGLVTVIIAAVSFLYLMRDRAQNPPKVVERQITANPAEDYASGGAISPDGKTVAYHDQTGVYLRSLESGETRAVPLLAEFSNRISNVSWWPDGKSLIIQRLAAEDSPGCTDLWTISVTAEPIPHLLLKGVCNESISPDGASLAFTAELSPAKLNGLWVAGLKDGTRRSLRLMNKDLLFSSVWSPDGRWIAYVRSRMTTEGFTSSIEVQPATGGPAKTIVRHTSLPQHTVICFLGSTGGPCLTWLADWRLVFTTFMDPNEPGLERDNGIWAIATVRGSGDPAGKPQRLAGWRDAGAGSLAATRDGKHLTFLKTSSWEDVYLAELLPDSRNMRLPRRLTLDNRGSEPSGWTLNGQSILFSSNRNGRTEIFSQPINSPVATPVAECAGKNCADAVMTPDGSWMLYREALGGLPMPNTPGPPVRLMRQRAAGELPQPVLEEPADREWNFACPINPQSFCVVAQNEGTELVFYELDPIRGKGVKLGAVKRKYVSGFRDWNVSPDGSQIAFASPDGRIKVLSVRSGSWHDIRVERGWLKLQSIAWAANQRGFFVTCWLPESFDLIYVSLGGKVSRLWHNGRRQAISEPMPSPNGKYLAFDAETWDSNVWMLDNV